MTRPTRATNKAQVRNFILQNSEIEKQIGPKFLKLVPNSWNFFEGFEISWKLLMLVQHKNISCFDIFDSTLAFCNSLYFTFFNFESRETF